MYARPEAGGQVSHLDDRCQLERLQLMAAMAGQVTHDVNNALFAILGFTALTRTALRAHGDSEKVLGHLNEIEAAGERGRLLVRQLSALAADASPASPTTAVGGIVEEVVTLLASSFPAGVVLSAHCDAELPALAVDCAHLHRLLSNLCRYARELVTPPARVVLSAAAHACSPDERCASCDGRLGGRTLRLAVAGHGCSLPAHLRRRLLTSPLTPTEVGRYADIGLFVVHGLAHFYGGHVQVLTTPGGDELAVLLPLAAAPSLTAVAGAGPGNEGPFPSP